MRPGYWGLVLVLLLVAAAVVFRPNVPGDPSPPAPLGDEDSELNPQIGETPVPSAVVSSAPAPWSSVLSSEEWVELREPMRLLSFHRYRTQADYEFVTNLMDRHPNCHEIPSMALERAIDDGSEAVVMRVVELVGPRFARVPDRTRARLLLQLVHAADRSVGYAPALVALIEGERDEIVLTRIFSCIWFQCTATRHVAVLRILRDRMSNDTVRSQIDTVIGN